MNIHINLEDHIILMNRTIVSFEMGSHLYGLNNKHSDVDRLCIYAPTVKELTSPVDSFHQLQYTLKHTNHNSPLTYSIDYVYTSLPNFFRNLMSGDSTINFEVLYHPMFNQHFGFTPNPSNFVSYSLIRSYLGMARRDMKQVTKMPTEREKWSKLTHIVRGIHTAEMLFNGTFNFGVFREGHELFDTLKMLKNQPGKFYGELSQNTIVEYNYRHDELREKLNKSLESGSIKPVPSPAIVNLVNESVANIVDSDMLGGEDSYLANYYNAAYNGIKY